MASSRKIAIGDDVIYLGTIPGKITAIGKGLTKYQIKWRNGKVEHYSASDFRKGLVAVVLPRIPEKPLVSPYEQASIGMAEILTADPLKTPTDLTGQHFWCDLHTVAVTVVNMRFLTIDNQIFDNALGVECSPWWEKNHTLGKTARIKRTELEPIEKFFSRYPEDRPDGWVDIDSCEGHRANSTKKPEVPTSKELKGIEKPVKTKRPQGGSLYCYTSTKAGITYPKVEGDRCKSEDSHWFWGFSYLEKVDDKWRSRSASVSRKKLNAVREALSLGCSYLELLRLLGKL